MAERLTVSLEDGTLEKLRQMAGGQRKVGAFLSDAVALLWDSREALEALGPQGCIVLPKALSQEMLGGADKKTIMDKLNEVQAKFEEVEARLNALDAQQQPTHAGGQQQQ